MQILKVVDARGVEFATLYPVPPQTDGTGWLSVVILRQGMNIEEAAEFFLQFGNALAIARGDIKAAAQAQRLAPEGVA